jgi:hypothetical protein
MEFLQQSILPQEQRGYQPRKTQGITQIMEVLVKIAHYHILFSCELLCHIPSDQYEWRLEGIYDKDLHYIEMGLHRTEKMNNVNMPSEGS